MNKPLNIGIDIRDLRLAKTGTKTYLEELCKAFKALESESYHFHFLDTRLSLKADGTKTAKYMEHFHYQLWKQIILPFKAWQKKCDVLFCTDNFVPLIHLGYQTVPVFHDAFFFENPEHYGKLWLKLYYHTALPAAKKSAFIITPTNYAKHQIHQFTGIPLAQLKVVYEGPKAIQTQIDQSVLSGYNLQERNYILHVGSMFKRKNIPALIYAFKQLKTRTNSTVKLVLAGPSSANKNSNDFKFILAAIADTQLQEEIILTGYLSDRELAGIYTHALMYVFPSLNEGFGIPILEAFQYHLPVLVADNTCLPEVGADAVLQFDPFDVQDIANKMQMVLMEDDLRNELIEKGKHRLKDFSWTNTAAQLLQLFRQI